MSKPLRPLGKREVPPAPDATCAPGFVWRTARSDDLVCVMPASRSATSSPKKTAPPRSAGVRAARTAPRPASLASSGARHSSATRCASRQSGARTCSRRTSSGRRTAPRAEAGGPRGNPGAPRAPTASPAAPREIPITPLACWRRTRSCALQSHRVRQSGRQKNRSRNVPTSGD